MKQCIHAAKSKPICQIPPVMILCGGKGTRLREVTELLPKPMVPIGEQPILWHIMKTYAAFGVRRFILCLGYKKESFIDYFMNYHLRTSDATITLGHNPQIQFHNESGESDWQVTLAATGEETLTGGRVAIASKYLAPDDEDFFLTYGDGVSDIDIGALYRFHQRHQKLLTISAVHPAARYGEMFIEHGEVAGFDEKPIRSKVYINGGFQVINRKFIERFIAGAEDDYLERGPFDRAIASHDVAAYQHEGFWQCMDTPREFQLLNDLWKSGCAPWKKYWDKNDV